MPVLTPTVRRLVTAEILLVATSLAFLAADVRPIGTLLAAGALSLVPFVTVRGKPVVDWLRVTWRFLSGRVPHIGVTTEHTDSVGLPVGVHWQRDTVTCTIEILAPTYATTVLGRASADTQYALPVEALTSCFRQHDIDVSSIDIVALGSRSAAGSVAADVYEQLIGPLPAVADRTVWVAVTVDLRANARAIEVRGGGRAGAAATAVIAATRVMRALDTRGLSSRLLTRAELGSAVLHLCRGVGTNDLTQMWSAAPLPGASSTGFGIDCSTVTAEDISVLWATPSLSTTVSFHLQPSREHAKVHVRGASRFTNRTPVTKPHARCLTSLSGSQRDAILMQLPLAVPIPKSLSHNRTLTVSALNELTLPVSGCGQLLGSDADGHGVALRLFGPGLSRIRIAGELYLAQQLLFRAIAIGARVVVRTDRPHAWRSLQDSIGAPDRLLVERNTSRARPSYTVLLLDFADDSAPSEQQRLPGVTVMSLTEHEPTSDRTAQLSEPDLSIVQARASGDRIRVRSGALEVELTLVTIPQETAFIGRPRSLRPAVRA